MRRPAKRPLIDPAALRRFQNRWMMPATLATMLLLLILVYLSPWLIVTVPPGQAAVVWRRFAGGTDLTQSMAEGTHLILPWNVAYLYDLRYQMVTETYDVITKDGLTVTVTIAFRFAIDRDHVAALHKWVGPNYLKVLVVPEIGSHARTIISQFTAEDFYTNRRIEVQEGIQRLVRERFAASANGGASPTGSLISLDDVLIKSIELPERVATAIERKVERYQQALEYDYRLMAEAKEADRKRIEGEGVRALFDRVGADGVDRYLRLAGINATLQLASSPNAKVVALNGTNGLPLILGMDAPAGQTMPAAQTTPAGAAAPSPLPRLPVPVPDTAPPASDHPESKP